MKKSKCNFNRHFKRRLVKYKERLKKKWFIWVLVQIVLLLLFFSALYKTIPLNVNVDNCKEALISVEDKEYALVYTEYRCRIYSNEIRYDFPHLDTFDKYTSRELYDALKTGDTLNIKYVKRYGFFGEYNLIVDARNESTVYIDFDSYNYGSSIIVAIVFFLILELIFCLYIFTTS